MNDPILASYLKEFTSTFNLEKLNDSDAFEYFSAYCVYYRDFSDYTDLEDVVVSGGNDAGIDAVGIFLNDVFVDSHAQIDEAALRPRLDGDFVFVQAKTSRNLNAAEIGSYIQGVREFFSKKYMPVNEDIARMRDLSDYVFSYSVKMRTRQKLYMYYCYTGKFKSDPTIVARVDAGKAALTALNLFSEVIFVFLDADSLQRNYQEINLRVEKEIQISEYATLPTIAGVRQAYLGIVSCREIVKLLSNSDGRLQKSLFNENVRDYLGRNAVNDEIVKTVTSPKQGQLAALNNGITIVAREIRLVGKKFTLSDFQIVNGCQTSHVIFENQSSLMPDTSIPVKMIEVEDRDIINSIVRATNRQTEIKDEALEVLGDFHRKLEMFFTSIEADPDRKLVYERRKRQYASSAYTAKNIVTLTSFTNGFVSCFLENPVDAVDYYGVLLRKYSGSIFSEDHSLWPYLVSAIILKEIEKRCVGKSGRNIWKFRFIIALLVRKSYGKIQNLKNEKEQRQFAEVIIKSSKDKDDFDSHLKTAVTLLADELKAQGEAFDKLNAHQDRKFVDKLIAAAGQIEPLP